ncbi:hypothetical protein FG386_002316 [Cryptosporidium ryanae]|uniref:uncharacterized protein n=1 Tax=Cryptosporidium ryanae TaxID=515981 RepID=UPI00351A71A1|nr:hypothetical protein FG386_002316 [Cryptosporidium ryanae]
MSDFGQNRRAKRYAQEICQWLDGLLGDDGLEECIEFEMNNTIEGLSKKLIDVSKENMKYKLELEELNSKFSEMSEYVNLKTKMNELRQEYEGYKKESEIRVYNLEKRNEKITEEKTRLELMNSNLEERNKLLMSNNEDLIGKLNRQSEELNEKTREKVQIEEESMRIESKYRSEISELKSENSELELKCNKLNDMVLLQKEDIEKQYSIEINNRDLQIQKLNEDCIHNKYRITELEKLLKMAEDEQLVSKNYRSLIEQYKGRLQVLEDSERNYLELKEKWNSQEKLIRQQSQKLLQAEEWLRKMIELEKLNSTLNQQIKQWETMALRYTHNLRIYNNGAVFTESGLKEDDKPISEEKLAENSQSLNEIEDNSNNSDQILSGDRNIKDNGISPTSVLSAIFEFQRRYQDVLVSKTVIESSKIELENKVDVLESNLQVSQREIKYYEDELTLKTNEINLLTENNKKLECEISVLKECLNKEGKTLNGKETIKNIKCGTSDSNLDNNLMLLDSTKTREINSGRTSIINGQDTNKLVLEEKMKIITHLENELKLRNEEIKTYWSIRVAYDTLTQERDSLLETSNNLQNQNEELKNKIIIMSDKIKLYEKNKSSLSMREVNEDKCNIEDYTVLKNKYHQEQERNQTLNEYYIKERSNLIDAISNILGWRIEIIYVDGGLTAYKLSNIFSEHGGELIFVIRPAPIDGCVNNNMVAAGSSLPTSNISNTTTFLLSTDENHNSEIEMEEQLTLDFIGYYANKFEEDSNWAMQLTATQSYPAFMAYTCLEEFHNTSTTNKNEKGFVEQNSQDKAVQNKRIRSE